MAPGICWILRGITLTTLASQGTRRPLNWTGLKSIQTPVQFVA